MSSTTRDQDATNTAEEALRQSNRRLALLSDTARKLLASRNPQQVVDDLCREVMAVIGADVFFNFLLDENCHRLHLNACAGIPDDTVRSIEWLDYGVAVCGCVARDSERIIANDIQHSSDPRTLLVKSFGVQSYVCHPLLSPDGTIGTLSFGSRTKTEFTPDDIDLMRSVADLVAMGMERIRTETRLRESEQRFRLIALNSPDSIFYQDCNLVYTWFINPGESYSVEEIIGKSDDDLFAPEEAERMAVLKRRVLDYGVSVRDEIPLLINGTQRWYDAVYQPWRDEHGRIIGVAGYSRDITERKIAEQALIRERAFLDTVIETLPIPLSLVAPSGDVFHRNRAAREFVEQYAPYHFDKVRFLDPVTRAELPVEKVPVSRALRGETLDCVEMIMALPDEREVPIICNAAPIRAGDDIVSAVVIYQDVTALKEADRAKNEFLAVLSHELHTPLTCILGWSAMALENGTPEVLTQAMTVINRNAVRQRRLVDEILDMSRLLHHKIHPIPEMVDLRAQARQAMENVQQQAQAQGLTVSLALPEETLPVWVDPTRIQQCIGNLLHNSLKFTEPGGAISITCQRQGSEAVLTVTDTGRGIDQEQLPTLFAIFRQVDRDERAGGLGLGLAITRSLLELQQGRITADSPGLGEGSTFTITLPLAEEPTAEA